MFNSKTSIIRTLPLVALLAAGGAMAQGGGTATSRSAGADVGANVGVSVGGQGGGTTSSGINADTRARANAQVSGNTSAKGDATLVDKARNAGHATVEGTKKVGRATRDVATDAGHATKNAANHTSDKIQGKLGSGVTSADVNAQAKAGTSGTVRAP